MRHHGFGIIRSKSENPHQDMRGYTDARVECEQIPCQNQENNRRS